MIYTVGNTGLEISIPTDKANSNGLIHYLPDISASSSSSKEVRRRHAITFLAAMHEFIEEATKRNIFEGRGEISLCESTNQTFFTFLVKQFGKDIVQEVSRTNDFNIKFSINLNELINFGDGVLVSYLGQMHKIAQSKNYNTWVSRY